MSVTTIIVKELPKGKPENNTFNEFKSPGLANIKNTDPSVLVGRIVERVNNSINIVIDDETIGGDRIGAVTSFDNNYLNSFRFGKDVKFPKHLLNDKLSSNVSLGNEGAIDRNNNGIFDNNLEICNYGQEISFRTSEDFTGKFIPFDDFEGRPSPESFLKSPDDLQGYPYVYNPKKTYGQYIDPDIASINGAIDVFHLRSSPISTGISDIQIRGARGLFGVGNWELSQHSTYGKKGSSFLENHFEIEEYESSDFYEDSQDKLLTKNIDGYLSNNKYMIKPFVEKIDYFSEEYEHLSSDKRTTLLASSSRSDSEIGTRFKSKDNGFIMTPFYQLSEQRSFGTDSIAFSGLLKG